MKRITFSFIILIIFSGSIWAQTKITAEKFEDKIDLDGVVGVQKNLDTAKERPVRVVTA